MKTIKEIDNEFKVWASDRLNIFKDVKFKNIDKEFDEKFVYKDALTDGNKIKQFYNTKISKLLRQIKKLEKTTDYSKYCLSCEDNGYNEALRDINNIIKNSEFKDLINKK